MVGASARRTHCAEAFIRLRDHRLPFKLFPKDEVLSAQCAIEIRILYAFGQLNGNHDRHFDNLALFDRYDGHLIRAPVDDMLPMLFAPAIDQIVERTFTMPHPTSDTLSVWEQARELAQVYWERIDAEPRMSADFHALRGAVLKSFSSRSQSTQAHARPWVSAPQAGKPINP